MCDAFCVRVGVLWRVCRGVAVSLLAVLLTVLANTGAPHARYGKFDHVKGDLYQPVAEVKSKL